MWANSVWGLVSLSGACFLCWLGMIAAKQKQPWRKFLAFGGMGFLVLAAIVFFWPHESGVPPTIGDCNNNSVSGTGNTQNNNCSKTIVQTHQRHLTAKQTADLVAAARPTCGQRQIDVTAANSNNEAQIYGLEFVAAFKSVGCHSDLTLPIPGLLPNVMGINIGIRPNATSLDDLKSNNPGAYFLYNVLSASHIPFKLGNLTPDFFRESQFVLVIGADETPAS